MQLGSHVLRNGLFVAPMAGVTDRPFRALCRRYGAGLAVSEMVSSRPELRATRKSRLRLEHRGETGPVSVQIAGADPRMMADAARINAAEGAQIVDINMGCPAKKVCNVAAGSALLSDEGRVAAILDSVVRAVDVPVTLKIRTGPAPGNRNAVRIARMAEDAGIAALAVHGRTRACAFVGAVEYDTIRAVKASVAIPVIANGDVDTPERAREARALIVEHLHDHYAFHGADIGVRTARKHLAWYTAALEGGAAFRRVMNACETTAAQLTAVNDYFDTLAHRDERLRYLAQPWAGEA